MLKQGEPLAACARLFGAVGALIGGFVIAMWILSPGRLESLQPSLVPSSPNSAIVLLLCSLSLVFFTLAARFRNAAIAFAALAMLYSLAGLAEHVFNLQLLISRGAVGTLMHSELPLRGMSFATVICALLSSGMLLLHREWPQRRAAEPVLHLLGVIAAYTPLGYLFGVNSYAGYTGSLIMSVYSGAGFLAIYVGLVFLRGRRGALGVLLDPGPGGRLSRIVLPIVLVIPYVNAWLRMRAEQLGLLSPEAASVLVATSNALIITVVLLSICWMLNRADEKRSIQEQALRKLFDSSLLGAFVWNSEGRIVTANQLFLDMLGYSSEDLTAGRLRWDTITPAGSEALISRKWQTVLESGSTAPFELELLTANGRRIPALVGSTLIYPEKGECAAYVLDNSELRNSREMVEERNAELEQLNDELAKSEQRQREVLEAPLIGVAHWKVDGTIFTANNLFLEMLGYKREDMEQGRLSWRTLQPPEVDYEQHRERRLRQMADGGRAVPHEQDLICRDGGRLPVMLSSMLLDHKGESGVTFMLDMRQQRRDRELLEERNAELEQLNNELAQSEARLRSIFDAPLLGLGFWNLDGRVMDSNDKLLSMLGYSREDLASGRLRLENLPLPGEPVSLPGRREQLLERGQLDPIEREFQRQDGSVIKVLLANMLLSPESGDCVALMLDNTEQARSRELIEERNAELVKLNQELAASEERLRRIFESPLIGIMQLRPDGTLLHANKCLLDMLGYSADEFSSGQISLYDITRSEEHAQIRENWKHVLSARTAVQFERTYIRKDGSEMPALVGVRMLEGSQQEAISFVLDITETVKARHELERQSLALRISEQRLRRVFETPLVGMSIANLETGMITDANHAFLDMVGYAEEDLEGGNLSWARLSPPDLKGDRTEARTQRFYKLLEEGFVEPQESVFVRKDGSLLTVLSGASMLDRESTETVGFTIDITEQMRQRQIIEERNAELQARAEEVGSLAADLRGRNEMLEQMRVSQQRANQELSLANAELEKLNSELKSKEERLRSLFESSLFGVFYWRRSDKQVVQANKIFLETFGYSAQDISAGKLNWNKLWTPEYLESDARENRIAELIEHGHTVPMEHDLMRSDGSRLPVLMASVLLDEQAEEGATFVLDNTEQRNSREQLEARNTDLRRINEELDAFSYSVSHDLRAPLRAIDGFSQALEEDFGEQLTGEAQEHLKRIRRGARRMGGLIDDLLGLARISRAGINRVTVDLSQLARNVDAELRQRHPEQSVEFICPEGLSCNADPRLLRVALENLFGNAWKYSGRRPEPRVELGHETDERGREVFFVKDNGVGFDQRYVDKLFTPFQRLHSPEEFEGSGIGLATVKRIVGRHGGKIWAKGELGQGATIFFQLESG